VSPYRFEKAIDFNRGILSDCSQAFTIQADSPKEAATKGLMLLAERGYDPWSHPLFSECLVRCMNTGAKSFFMLKHVLPPKGETEPLKFFRVSYSHNNSGGEDWMSSEDWESLQRADWVLRGRHSDGSPFGAEIEIQADSLREALREGVSRWEQITRGNADALGCDCCGPPHSFHAETRDDEKDYDFVSR